MLTLDYCGKKIVVLPAPWPTQYMDECTYAEVGCEQALFFKFGKGVRELGEGTIYSPNNTKLTGTTINKQVNTVLPINKGQEVFELKVIYSRFAGWRYDVMSVDLFRKMSIELQNNLIDYLNNQYDKAKVIFKEKHGENSCRLVRGLPKLNLGEGCGRNKAIKAVWFSLVCGVKAE
jgi:hypothetical protein